VSARDPIQRLVHALGRLPGVGEKTATRLAFHVLRAPDDLARELSQALVEIKERVRLCSVCMNLTSEDPCALCADPRRDDKILCVVASPPDLHAIERTAGYRGRYHVLHGLLSPLDGVGPDDLRIKELLARVAALTSDPRGSALSDETRAASAPAESETRADSKHSETRAASARWGEAREAVPSVGGRARPPLIEVIVATSPNVEGEATALYLGRLLRPLGVRVTRIASGLQVGGELEYADGMTIARALEARRDL
jgi:recombination protein RecR